VVRSLADMLQPGGIVELGHMYGRAQKCYVGPRSVKTSTVFTNSRSRTRAMNCSAPARLTEASITDRSYAGSTRHESWRTRMRPAVQSTSRAPAQRD
jgi:hypothetical protein